MARLARTVPGLPHHVTERGNQTEPNFFEDGDQEIYCDLLAEQTRKSGVEVWAYCLMPNHVHLILTPSTEKGLGMALGETHRRWANWVNARGRWRGHLFEGRFASVAMDEAHLISAARYVSLNPVRARLAVRAEDWPWSSVRAHLKGEDDGLVVVRPLLDRVERFGELIAEEPQIEAAHARAMQALRASEGIGRPLGTADFVKDLEQRLGRPLARRAPGRRSAAPLTEQATLL